MSAILTYPEFIESLSAKADGRPIDPEIGLFEQRHLDSVDVIEWLYELEERYQITFDKVTAEFAATKSVRELYDAICGQTGLDA